MSMPLNGLWPPVATPFRPTGEIDYHALVKHSKTLLADGATGLALLGTTSEANSLTVDERRHAIDVHLKSGIPPNKLLPGSGACVLEDAITLTRHAGEVGAAGVLLLPPFFYKNVTDEWLFRFVAELIERVGADTPKILLYHIPPIAQVGWSLELIDRLKQAFPKVVVGIKDSSGHFEYTMKLINAFPDFAVFPGSEVYLLKALAAGAVGCISASANVNAKGISGLIRRWREPGAEMVQEELILVRRALERTVMIPSLKAILARRHGTATWEKVRAPLVEISDAARDELFSNSAISELLESYAAYSGEESVV